MAAPRLRAPGHRGRAPERSAHRQHRALCRLPAASLRGGRLRPASCGLDWRRRRLRRLRPPLHPWVIWTANRSASSAALPASQRSAACRMAATPWARSSLRPSVAAIVDFALDFILNALTLVLRGTGSVRDLARTTWPRRACRNPPVHIACRPSCLQLFAFTSLECGALLHSRAGGSEALRHLSRAAEGSRRILLRPTTGSNALTSRSRLR